MRRHWAASALASVGTVRQREFYLGAELMRVLEQCAVSGVGVKDQARIGQMLRKNVGINRRNHHVIDPIEDEGGLLDFLQPRVTFAFRLSPRFDSDGLSF